MTPALMPTLRAGTLVLEPQAAAHADEMFAVLSDPAIYEYENEPPASVDWLRRRYARLESRASPDGAEQWLNWVVRLPSGEAAGYVQATVRDDGTARAAHVAYELSSRFWRQGIGTAAVRAMLDALRDHYGVTRAVAVLKARNARSAALLARLGFADAPPDGWRPAVCEADECARYRRLAP
jgi:RimJ/RimL family protein N-acetyltransferase